MPATIVPGPGWRGEQPEPIGEDIVDWSSRDLRGGEAARELVSGVIAEGSVCLFSGRSGAGKTSLLLDLMVAAATGGPWLGLNVAQCKSFGLFCEDPLARLDQRIARILAYRGVRQPDLEGRMQGMSRYGKRSHLLRFDWRTKAEAPLPLWQQLISPIGGWLAGVQLLILDTLGDILVGSQNDSEIAVNTVLFFTEWAVAHNACVILTTHPPAGMGQDKEWAGAREWHTKPRSHLHLTSKNGERKLRIVKNSYGAEADPIPIRWDQDWGLFVVDEPLPVRERADLL